MLKHLVLVERLTKNQMAAGKVPNKHLSNGKVNNQMYFSMMNYTAQVTCGLSFLESFV